MSAPIAPHDSNGRRPPRRGAKHFLIALLAAASVAAFSSAPANAALPANDDFANAVTVSSLPFTDTVDISQATSEPGEPSFCGAIETVWYSFTPSSDVVVRASPAGSNFFSPNITIFRADGPGLGGLTWLNCGQFGSDVVFQAHAGTTYYIQGGSVFFNGGTLALTLTSVPAPTNNDFANAAPINAVPFSDSVDITGATTEPGEPINNCGGQFTNTVWYSFTPSTSGTYSAGASSLINGGVNVYTGSTFANLNRIACGSSGTGIGSFHADAGVTYYLQSGTFGALGNLRTSLDLAPPPAVGFIWGPPDPSMFDVVHFFDQSFDPANIGIQTRDWNFGDGATAIGTPVTHQFAKDGDYSVKLTDTTTDGRSNTATNLIQVRTHDVAISKLAVPTNGSVGKTVQIVVKLTNTHYAEDVQVQLYRSSQGGFDQVASTTQTVPAMKKGQTFDVKLVYTFTAADAALGKVTFKATALLQGARDALPADNDAIAPPTIVKP
jgi:hypothetical protein